MTGIALLEKVFLGNDLRAWVIALGLCAASFILLHAMKGFLVRRLTRLSTRTRTGLDDLVVEILAHTKNYFIFFVSAYLGLLTLKVPAKGSQIAEKALVLVLIMQLASWGLRGVEFWVERHLKKRAQQDVATATTLGLVSFAAKFVLFALLFLVALNNLGVDITALVAGLGVGGIAIALAVQNILGDLFASLTIVLDKPFVVGDFVIVDNFKGTIEQIGLKTTRVRSLSGEQLIFPNSNLLQSRIANYKRMYERRVVFTLGVVYQTPAEKLKRIPAILKEVIEKRSGTRFDRSHFVLYGASSLDFETVYWINDPNYNQFADIHQEVLFEIFERFGREGLDFAYPTQTVFLEHATQPKA